MKRGRKPVLGGRIARGADWLPDHEDAIALSALPQPPRHLGPEARGHYCVLVAGLAKRRAVERADIPMIEMAASAYGEWFRLDREIHEQDALMAASEKTKGMFMSGQAQARAAAANAYRRAIAQLGLGSPAARLAVFGNPQTDFLDKLDGVSGQAADPYEPRTRH